MYTQLRTDVCLQKLKAGMQCHCQWSESYRTKISEFLELVEVVETINGMFPRGERLASGTAGGQV